ncbi:MAG: hypothetical protein KGZ67_12195 [Hydrogenophaga sp.]|jgi:hypothetical protein|nr:hypothetical protein [Hydrogenophaga sp.]
MRFVFSLGGLLMAVALIGWLAKGQLSGRAAPAQVPGLSAPSDGAALPSGSPAAIQQQYRKALEDALQQPRSTQDP